MLNADGAWRIFKSWKIAYRIDREAKVVYVVRGETEFFEAFPLRTGSEKPLETVACLPMPPTPR